jgi:signal transduction histidine kinase
MPNAIIRSTPVRLTALLGAVFLLALVLTGFIAFALIRQELAGRTDQTVAETYAVIARAYTDNDDDDLRQSVASHSLSTADADRIYLLQDANGQKVAGNLETGNFAEGWSTVSPASVRDTEPGSDYRVLSGAVGGYRLTVGVSLSEGDEIAGLMLTALVLAGVALVVMVAITGLFVAIRGQRRLDQISSTMADVGRGNLGARITLSRRNDDVDRIGRDVNTALDRLVALVEGMRQVSVDIAHELKTPLNRLGIAIESALESNERGADVAPLLEQAQAEGRTINSTFDALLRIAQIESGARRARFTDLALGPVLDNVADAYGPVAAENRQELVLVPHPRLPLVHGDAELLTQLLANLVENAIRHCPPDARIQIWGERVGAGAVLIVSDTGPGIPEAERDKVFRRLYRLEKSRTTPGSGLGLSLVKAIAELHGAQVSLGDNAPGLIVRITFPATQEDHGAA